MNPKKNKKKKVKESKSKEQRHLEVEELKTQLDQIGINPTFESYNQLLKRLIPPIKGKKLTKISPKKTISGAFGSFLFSLMLVPFYLNVFTDYKMPVLILITLLVSLTSQIGDLFISFLKRKASVKDTSNLLPGHGGVLDRIDGMIFSIPACLIIFYL